MTQAGASHVVGLFPTPLQRVPGALEPELVAGLVRRFTERAQQQNASSDRLMHTETVSPKDHPLLQQASRALVPHVIDFGALLLGERLHWSMPTNQGERRITLAFNAIPHRLDSWGYALSLGR